MSEQPVSANSKYSNNNLLESSQHSFTAPSLMTLEKKQRKQQLKEQKSLYRESCRQISEELRKKLSKPDDFLTKDYLTARTTLKAWIRVFAILKPGFLILYKSEKPSKHRNWLGTIDLSHCKILERPSKKRGYCFKVFHSLSENFWMTKGPKGESLSSLRAYSLPVNHLILRTNDEVGAKCWIESIQIAIIGRNDSELLGAQGIKEKEHSANSSRANTPTESLSSSDSDSNCDFLDHDVEFVVNQEPVEEEIMPAETQYELDLTDANNCNLSFGAQKESMPKDNQSILWSVLKQLRPGKDLSRVTLPTIILEPRSFLEKFADANFHIDILEEAVKIEDPFKRMKTIIKFYLSGFYRKPVGIKKPYNSTLGEIFRCYWQHKDGTKTFYVSEGVSHHPIISAFYISNRKIGFTISGTVITKSKFYGNSVSIVLEGTVKLLLLERGEEYIITMPYALCKGIILGKMTLELGGNPVIVCDKTGYQCEIEFQLNSFFASNENANKIDGKVYFGRSKIKVATISGKWDKEMYWKDHKNDSPEEILWTVSEETKKSRLPWYTVPLEDQLPNESRRLWRDVTAGLLEHNHAKATEAKTRIEEAQRKTARELVEKGEEFKAKLFEYDHFSQLYVYKYRDERPWDDANDRFQYEHNGIIKVHGIHVMQRVHTLSRPMDSLKRTYRRRPSPLSSDQEIGDNNEKQEFVGETKLTAVSDNLEFLISELKISQSRIAAITDEVKKLSSYSHGWNFAFAIISMFLVNFLSLYIFLHLH